MPGEIRSTGDQSRKAEHRGEKSEVGAGGAGGPSRRKAIVEAIMVCEVEHRCGRRAARAAA